MKAKHKPDDMPLNLFYQYNAGGIAFSLYGYPADPAGHQAFCFLWAGSPPANPPDLPATWSQSGFYAFFPPATNPDWNSLGPALYALYNQYSRYALRFAWTDAAASRLLAGIYVDNGLVTAVSNLIIGQFQLLLKTATPAITVNGTNDGFSIVNNGLFWLPDSYDAASTPVPLSSALAITAGQQTQGTLNFTLGLTLAQLNACHAGLHYYHSEAAPVDPNQPDHDYYYTFDYPIFQPATPLSLQTSLDLLAPQDPLRTYFAPSGADPLPTFIATRTGYFVSLKPATTGIPGGNCFTLINYPKAAQRSGLFCLSLQGTYTLFLAADVNNNAADNVHQLLCGLAGTEHVGFVPLSADYAGDLIDFVPGKPALAPVFPILTQDQGNTKDAPLLVPDTYCQTSWIQIRKNTTPPAGNGINYYYCQPGDAALFKPASGNTFLQLFDAEAGNTYDSTQPTPIASLFPLVPYAAASGGGGDHPSPGTLADFEYQILNPTRKAAIVTKAAIANRESVYRTHKAANATTNTADLHYTTTPQGLLVQVDTSSSVQKWTSLVLATNADAKVPADALLWLENVSATIQSAFQTNQQFLVVSKKDSLGVAPGGVIDPVVTVFHNTISIAGWPFHLDIGANDYGDYSNVVLFKFCTGALVDRVQHIQGWTQPEDFAGDANAQLMLSRWLANYCTSIDSGYAGGNAAYENIHSIIHDANWNGILALNVDIGLSDFPEDIKGLLGGIDTTRFKAHHFGVEVNHITVVNSILTNPATSSLFGLIDYTDAGYINQQPPPGATDVDYDFKVLRLLVLFRNSAIVDFKSKLQLTINRLFNDAVTDTGGHTNQYNTILLDGSYENHNGQKSYIFTETGDQSFTLQSHVLPTVEILKVQFSTLSTDQNSDDVRSRFAIWGNLQFAPLPGFDAFSFATLSFSNLGIRMDFSDLNPAKRQFSFDPQDIAFDAGNSAGRPQSFVYNYPLALSGLLYGNGKQAPKDLGYLSVASPLDQQSQSIPASWYGLAFTINLGTVGALGSKVGLTATLLLAWGTGLTNPAANSFAAAVFIKLPGTGGSSNLFSLQNVLKLSIGSIRLFVDADAVAGTTAYLIKFNNIALKVLSKALPPNGRIGMFLFGDPRQHGQPVTDPSQSSLGWYAAYQKDKTKQ